MSARSKQGKGKGAGKRNPNSAGDTSPHSEVQSDASPQTTSRGEPDVPTPDVGVTPVSGVTPRQDPDGEAEPREFNEAPDEAVPVSKSIYNEVMATPSENSVSFPADAKVASGSEEEITEIGVESPGAKELVGIEADSIAAVEEGWFRSFFVCCVGRK